MKTQISSLRNGSIHKDGTNYETRKRIATKVIEENPEVLNVEIKGIKLSLIAEHSTSGYLTGYSCEISLDQFKEIESKDYNPFTFESCFTFEVGADMKAQISKFTRKSVNHKWQFRGWDNVDEKLITISECA